SPNTVNAQAVPNPAPADEAIPVGSYVIAMDNVYQGSAGGACNGFSFNLRAYGLAVRLLHNNIPLKWVISPTKTDKDDTDFTATVTRVYGQNCKNGGNYDFAGGPLVISQEYVAQAAPIIEAFNAEISSNSGKVRVYRTTQPTTAPVRYTLTHKPLVAVGPDGG